MSLYQKISSKNSVKSFSVLFEYSIADYLSIHDDLSVIVTSFSIVQVKNYKFY